MIDGLLGAGGEGLDKGRLEKLLANLGSRVFLMRNVNDAAPVLFRTRWTLSYLRGPLTLQEIAKLSRAPAATAARTSRCSRISPASPDQPSGRRNTSAAAETSRDPESSSESEKPVVPAGITELYLETSQANARYLPRVLGVARLHFVDKTAGLDVWETRSYIAPLADNETDVDWSQADVGADLQKQLSNAPPENARFAEAPAALLRAPNYRSWQKELVSHLLFECRAAHLPLPVGRPVRRARHQRRRLPRQARSGVARKARY